MDDRDIAAYHPSFLKLEMKESEYKTLRPSEKPPEDVESRINMRKGKLFTRVTSGKIKAKKADFVLDL